MLKNYDLSTKQIAKFVEIKRKIQRFRSYMESKAIFLLNITSMCSYLMKNFIFQRNFLKFKVQKG